MRKPRSNCWEYKSCGREPGGAHVTELGVCAAATRVEHDGANHGTAAGRICWAVAGTLCGGQVQGTFARKFASCLQCGFYLEVQEREGRFLQLVPKRKT